MNWKSLFSSSKNMTAQEAQIFLKKESSDAIQLIDVRQPKEYESEHLPGAILIPLKQILSRIDELDPALPTLVYCTSGVRSKRLTRPPGPVTNPPMPSTTCGLRRRSTRQAWVIARTRRSGAMIRLSQPSPRRR